jgi:hypothetical protein
MNFSFYLDLNMLKNIEAKIKNVNKDVPLIFSFTIINKGK